MTELEGVNLSLMTLNGLEYPCILEKEEMLLPATSIGKHRARVDFPVEHKLMLLYDPLKLNME